MLFAEVSSEQREGDAGMRLHRPGRCVTRNVGEIMSGTTQDVEESVSSLRSAGERIVGLFREETGVSPL